MSAMPEGGCTCRAVRYRMTREPMIVHGCHCRWCQRETGSCLAINAVLETASLDVLTGTPERIVTPSASGKGQTIVRCPTCRVAVWSHYPGGGAPLAFVRVGTLDDPDRYPPDVHIFTSSKQPWVVLPASAKAFDEFYDPADVWSPEARARWAATRSAAVASSAG